MKILLHIGQSKTGTSAIQSFLCLNRLHLRREGVLYPSVIVKGLPLALASHNAVADSLVGLSRFPHLTADEYFEQFFHEAQQTNAHLMILSAEHFFGGEPRIWDVSSAEEYYQKYRLKLENLAGFLSGHEVNVLAYLRPQVDWLASAISQTIRIEGLIARHLYKNDVQFFEMVKPLLNYTALIELWKEVLTPSQLTIVPYETSGLYGQSSISDFLHRVRLSHLDLPFKDVNQRINQSLSREFIEVKKKINLTHRTKVEERTIIACLEKLSKKSPFGTSYRLSDELVLRISKYVEHENLELNEKFIVSGMLLEAESPYHKEISFKELSPEVVDDAYVVFRKKYGSLNIRLILIGNEIRSFLRNHFQRLHSLTHQLRRLQYWLYVNSH